MKLLRAALVSFLSICVAASVAQSGQELPVVNSGEMPLYPSLARLARIQGDVRLKVTTDGSKVASVTVESGQPLLAKAAQDNVRTWRFIRHEPTAFSTVFSFRLTEKESCKHDEPDNGQAILRLPTYVEITVNTLIHAYCDPDAGLDLSDPLRVFLTACENNRSPIPCEEMKIRLRSGTSTVTPVRFKDSDTRQGFVVPEELRSVKSVDVTIDAGGTAFTVPDLDAHFLKGKWRVGIDHTPFKDDTDLYNMPGTVHCAGFIHFQWGEPEAIVWHRCD